MQSVEMMPLLSIIFSPEINGKPFDTEAAGKLGLEHLGHRVHFHGAGAQAVTETSLASCCSCLLFILLLFLFLELLASSLNC